MDTLTSNGIITTSEIVEYIQKSIDIINEEGDSTNLELLLREYIMEEHSDYSTAIVDAIADIIAQKFNKYNTIEDGVLDLCKRFNVCLPDIVNKAASLLLADTDPTPLSGLKDVLKAYVMETYTSFDEYIADKLATTIYNRYAEYTDMTEAADELMDEYAVGKNSNFISTNNEQVKFASMLVLDCMIVTDKKKES